MVAATSVINNLPKKGSSFNIGVISLKGDMTGSRNLALKRNLFSCLYEGRCLQLIDFAKVSRIDKRAVDTLHNLLDRGMQLRLFNVSPVIKRIIGSNRNKCLSEKILDVGSQDEAVLKFGEEITKLSKEGGFCFVDRIKKRPCPRFDISLPVEFRCDISHEHHVFFHAQSENISKKGIYVSQVHASKGLIRKNTHIKGKDLYNLSLNVRYAGIALETEGVCVREQRRSSDNLCLAIRFKNLNEYCEGVITGIVHDNTPLPNYLSYLEH
jgi:anti-anti-sigma regulatory factor